MKKKKKHKLERKAQLEMIGLIVIVIIVIISLMIFTVYKISNPQKGTQRRYINKEIATNMLISMTKTSVNECHNLSLGELITDCARTFHSITCYEHTSCKIANQTIFKILENTLVDWEVSFNFSIENTEINFINYDCNAKSTKVQGFEILPLYPGQIEMILDICMD